MACKAVWTAFFHNFAVAEAPSRPLGAFFFIFFAVVTSRDLFLFLLSNVRGLGTRHLVAGTQHPIVGRLYFAPMPFVVEPEINCLISWVIFSVVSGSYIEATP